MLTTRRKIALAAALQTGIMATRRSVGAGPQARVHRRGIEWNLDLREGIDFAIWLMGAFEPATVAACARLVPPGGIVLDIGANIGAHTLPLARLIGPRGRVYAFEPTDWAQAKLAVNLALNPDLAARVTRTQTMLTDRTDAVPAPLYASWPLAAAPGVHPLHRGRKMEVTGATATTLDAFLDREGVSRVDFIKLDIDGFEIPALRGARETLRRFHPAMVMELSPHQLAEQGGSIEELVALLAAADYRLTELDGSGDLPLDGAKLRALIAHGASRNAVALPRRRSA